MIRKQYFLHINSTCCYTIIQFSFFQSWDTCAAAETIMLTLLCEDSYAINRLQKKIISSQQVDAEVDVLGRSFEVLSSEAQSVTSIEAEQLGS